MKTYKITITGMTVHGEMRTDRYIVMAHNRWAAARIAASRTTILIATECRKERIA